MSSRRDNLAALTPYVNDGANRYDFAIAGIPFYTASQDNIPYQRQTSQFRKDQIDMAITPGEQSLQGWWYRSQNSFHLGAGIEYNDTLHDDNIKSRFAASSNLDVFTEPGKAKLLPAIRRVASNSPATEGAFLGEFPVTFSSQWRQIVPANPIINTESITEQGTTFAFYGVRRDIRESDGYVHDRLFGVFGAQFPVDSQASEIIYWQPGDPAQPKVTALAAIANGVIIATTSGLYQRSVVDGETTYFRRFTNTFDTIAIVKDRLVLTSGSDIWQVDPVPASNVAASTLVRKGDGWLYNHTDSTWKWVAITEGPTAIYIAGSPNGAASTNGEASDLSHAVSSTIYQIGLEQKTADSPPILRVPTTVAILPGGEYIRSMFCYMGTYLAIGTTAGIRIALMASDGSIGVGPISCVTQTPVDHIVAYQNFIWCTGQPTKRPTVNINTPWHNASMTLIKLDLSREVAANTLMFPWAEDQTYPGGFDLGEVAAGGKPQIFDLAILPDDAANAGVAVIGSPYVSTNAFRGPRLAFSFQLDADAETWYGAFPSPGESTEADAALRTGGIWVTDNNGSRGVGALETGRIRFDTSENKIFQYLRVATEHPIGANNDLLADGVESVEVHWLDSDGGGGNLATIDETGANLNWGVGPSTYEFDGSDATPHAWVAYQFILRGQTANALDPIVNYEGRPHFLGYQAKAQPANVRQRIIQVPLLMSQREAGPHGRIVERSVQERLRKLEQAEELNAVVLFQDFGTGETRPVIIEQLQFTTDFIPETRQTKAEKPGLLIATLRTINTSSHDNNTGA